MKEAEKVMPYSDIRAQLHSMTKIEVELELATLQRHMDTIREYQDLQNGKLLTNFWVFPKLPAELQLMIWKHAVVPRNIVLEPYFVGRQTPKTLRFRCFQKPVGMLLACRDARAAVLATYSAHVGPTSAKKMIPLDGLNDTVILLDFNPIATLTSALAKTVFAPLSNITKLAIRKMWLLGRHGHETTTARNIATCLPKLETLILLVDPGVDGLKSFDIPDGQLFLAPLEENTICLGNGRLVKVRDYARRKQEEDRERLQSALVQLMITASSDPGTLLVPRTTIPEIKLMRICKRD